MSEYTLPKGMTAGVLRDLADDMSQRGGWSTDAATVAAWADAIDPPAPPSVITDEMVEAVTATADLWPYGVGVRKVLEAAVRRSWTPPGEATTQVRGLSTMHAAEQAARLAAEVEVERLADRLAMAEGLLRRATMSDPGGNVWLYHPSRPTLPDDEAEYLKSLDGEGEA